jgi:predicted O-methyltransferase YrrM
MNDQLRSALDGVEGWLHLDEAEELQRMVRMHPLPKDQPITVLEIGTFKGRSAITFALAVRSRGEGRVYAVDPHWGGSREDFYKNITAAKLTDVIIPIERSSTEARAEIADGSVHVMYIDGGHEYDEVCQDIADWTSALADDAMVGFNDTHFPGVYRAVKEKILSEPLRWSHPHLVRSTLFLEYHRNGTEKGVDHRSMQRLSGVLAARRMAGSIQKVLPKPLRQAGNWVSRHLVG